MKPSVPLLVLLAALAYVGVSLLPPRNPGEYDVIGFGRLPILVNGRVKPLDTVARTSLLELQGRQRVVLPNGASLTPDEWLADVALGSPAADAYQNFEIVHPEVLALLHLAPEDGAGKKRFSYVQLAPNLPELQRQYQLAEPVETAVRSSFQKAVVKLFGNVVLYDNLHGSLVQPGEGDFLAGLSGLAQAWQLHQPAQFNQLIAAQQGRLQQRFGLELAKCAVEARFNAAAPFLTSMTLYITAFLLAVFSWLKWPGLLGRSAFRLVAVAFVVATIGIGLRMWLEGRPPVTNLYSSALFVGWGAAGLCLVLEAIHRNAIGSAAAGLIGFGTLLIAHHLALGGDTMEMMRAVLDSNFWLATHVVVVTTGYAATFLSGFLALIYIFRGVCTRTLDKATADALARMVYGIVCFATLFSLVGTVLGGIWADQSWGRFWGWDPKENGALVIVIWNAIILHARWGGMVKQRGLMVLAVFGNIVTSWSWFGVNMLGVGLHSYGFMDAAFWWLLAFVASQLAVIAVAGLPLAKWRSFQSVPAA